MRTTSTCVLVLALALTGLSSGCSLSSMEKKYKSATGKTETAGVELNSAHRKQLAELPGLTGADADRIISHRPYEKKRDMVQKGVLTEAQFDKIKDSVYVEHAK